MLEVDITKFMARKEEMIYYSASAAELGEDAGQVTWENSLDLAEEEPLIEDDGELEELAAYFEAMGAWEPEEIEAWTCTDLNAMLVQEIAAAIREKSDRIYQSGKCWYLMLD